MAGTNSKAMGVFVLGGLLLFSIGLFLIGDRRMLFSGSGSYYTEFAGMSGLEVGGKVRVAGLDAGEVTELRIPTGPGSKFRLKFRVIEKVFPVIRTDSVASIQTDGLLGNKYLLIDIGTTGQAPQESTLPSREPFELGDLMAKMAGTAKTIDDTVDEVKGNFMDAIKTASETATHLNDIVMASQDDIKKISANASRISGDASVITGRLSRGEGSLGKLMKDDTFYVNVANDSRQAGEILANLRQSSESVKDLLAKLKSGNVPENLEASIANVKDSTDKLKVMVSTLQPQGAGTGGLSGDLRATMANSREATQHLAEDMEALKHGFFFRAFFNNRGFFDLDTLSLAEYQSKNFEKKAHKEREWVHGADVFTTKTDGSEEISQAGRASIDKAMEGFQRFTEGIALIVEGYSETGTPSEQFIRSRSRAAMVRDYLITKFALNTNYVGMMAMGSPDSYPSQKAEGSVALVLLRK